MRRCRWWRLGARTAAAAAGGGEPPEEPGLEELPAVVQGEVVVSWPALRAWPRSRLVSVRCYVRLVDGD